MEAILSQLEIDMTVAYQFAVFFISYLVLSNVLFKKVLFVLQTREAKTTKLEENANVDFQKADQLAEEYREKIDEAYGEAQVSFNNVKNEALEEQKKVVTEEEQKLSKMIESETNVFVEEVNKKKQEVLSQSGDLAKDLVQKLVR